MRKLLLILFLIGTCLGVAAQARISVFVAGDLPNNGSKNLVADLLVQAFSESNQYIPVNRSAELTAILNKVHAIHEDGHIDAKQVANATKGYGETLVCGVNVYKVGYVSVFRASLVDVETEQIVKTKSVEELSAKFEDDKSVYPASVKVAKDLAGKLIDGYKSDLAETQKDNEITLQKEIEDQKKLAEQQRRREEREKRRKNNDLYIIFAPVNGFWPLNYSCELGFRYGSTLGFGAYLDTGVDFSWVSNQDCYLRAALGLQFYFYEGLNLDFGYGTIPPKHEPYYYSGNYGFPDHGIFFRIGYQDLYIGRKNRDDFAWGLLGGTFGVEYDVLTKEFFISAKVRVALFGWKVM